MRMRLDGEALLYMPNLCFGTMSNDPPAWVANVRKGIGLALEDADHLARFWVDGLVIGGKCRNGHQHGE
jgi:hypothetical protein